MEDFNPQDELLYIKKVIEDSKRSYVEDGRDYILWGVIVTVGLIATYFSILARQFHYTQITWIVLGGFGWAFSFYSHRRGGKRHKARTFAGRVVTSVWIAVGLTLTVFLMVGLLFRVYPDYMISPLAAIINGIGFFITGAVISNNWIRGLSFCWWGGALYMLFFPSLEMILVLAGMMLFFQTLPGVIIYFRWKKEAAANGDV